MCVHVRRRNVSVLRCAHRRHIITRCAHVHTYVTSSHMCRTIIRGVHVHTDEGRMETGRRRARAGGQDESMRAEEHASAEGGILALGHNRRHARTTNTDVRAHAHGPSGTRTRTRCAGRLSRGCANARVGSHTHSVGRPTAPSEHTTHRHAACSHGGARAWQEHGTGFGPDWPTRAARGPSAASERPRIALLV